MKRLVGLATAVTVGGCAAIAGVDRDFYEVKDAGAPTSDSGTPNDARGGDGAPGKEAGPSSGIRCGSATCNPATEVCCSDSIRCVAAASCPVAAAECDDTADCVARGQPGKVCCAKGSSIQCEDLSSCQGVNVDVLCDPAVSTPGCRCTERTQRLGQTFDKCD